MENSNVKLSVLLVTYNHESLIHKAIEGALMQQTDFMYELVIGEDCSTDNTLSICRSYQNKSPSKIKILANKINLGLNLNFINTLKACKGQYIAYLEGDDHWKTSDKLQKQVDIMEQNPDISLIHTNFCVHDIDLESLKFSAGC